MASFSAGTTFTDGVANDVTAAKLGALVNNATPTSGFIQDRTAETITATNDTLLIGDASDSNNLKRITVANFAQTLPTAKITTGTIETGTFGTTTSTAATITTGTITTGVIPTLTSGTTTSTAATITTGTIPTLVATTLITSGTGTAAAPAIVPTGDTNTGIFFPAADTAAIATQGTEAMRIDSSGNVGVKNTAPSTTFSAVSGYGIAVGDGTGSPSIALYGANNAGQGLYFGDSNTGTAAYSGYVDYLHQSDALRLGTGSTERLRIDSSGNVGVGTTSPTNNIGWTTLALNSSTNGGLLELQKNGTRTFLLFNPSGSSDTTIQAETSNNLRLGAGGSERLRITSVGNVLINKTVSSLSGVGVELGADGEGLFIRDSSQVLGINRKTTDGLLISFYQDGVSEGSISVSGTTVSYNGGHLSRFSQLPSGQRDPAIRKGTVLSNLDEMCLWNDAEGNPLPNEQLNKVKISDVEGDSNVAGVFVNWDDDDQDNPFDLNMAMTGDMIIRIAQGVSVNRGDLLMSAGDGTAKPQGDDMVRSKTIAKVTSTHVTCTYEDGSYCVPCVLMAC